MKKDGSPAGEGVGVLLVAHVYIQKEVPRLKDSTGARSEQKQPFRADLCWTDLEGHLFFAQTASQKQGAKSWNRLR